MAANQPPTCPECRLPADRHRELLPVERSVVCQTDGVLTIRGLISEKLYENPERPELLCPRGHGFPIPADIELTYV